MNLKVLPWLITICALGLGGTAGYYSVIGLSKLFAGEATAVIIMASFLEASKLVLATLLHTYWKKLNTLLKVYYILALIVLSLITSVGIYGMLSSGYQKTSSQLSVVDNQKSYIDKKIEFYQKDLNRYDAELERISNNISILSNAKSVTTQIKDKSIEGGVRSVVSTTELKMAQQRISLEEENRKDNISKRQIVADSLQKFQLQVLELENNTEVAGELGPLKYISNLTGKSMDTIINWLLLIIIFVFDPLAISLVIAANFAFKNSKLTPNPTQFPLPHSSQNLPNLNPLPEVQEIEDKKEENTFTEGLHSYKDSKVEEKYDVLDLNQDGEVDKYEIQEAKNKIQQLKEYLQNPNLSGWRKSKIQREIDNLNFQLQKDDETKTY
jgi:hypothetical protein